MFKIFAVEIEDFKCFRGSHIFEFPDEPGLYYLTGKNEYNTRLGANGTGKTSLIDAVSWCLYGKTSRGLRASDVVTWGKKKCSVSVSVMVGGREVSITRTQGPNTLTVDGQGATQEEVEQLLRLKQDAFMASVILPQFGESFFDLGPTQKLGMFSQIMGLDYWLDKSDQAKEKAGVTYQAIMQLDGQLSKLDGRLEATRADSKDLKKKIKTFDKEMARVRKDLIAERKKLEGRYSAAKAKLKKLGKTSTKDDKALEEVTAAIHECGNEFSKANDDLARVVAEIRYADRTVKDIDGELKDLRALKGDICPTCKQKVGAGHVDSHHDKLSKKLVKVIKEVNTLKAEEAKLHEKLNELRKDINDLRVLRDELKSKVDDRAEELRSAKNKVERVEADLQHCERDIKKLEGKDNPYNDLLKNRRNAIKEMKAERADLIEELERLKEKHEAISYWVGGFKRVRLFVIEDALTALEVEVNNLLITLGLIDWKITFDVERENKSGGVTKGFSVFIHSPKHSEPVKWEAFSGGETQRLRLAGDLGLANLIMEQAGLTNYIEILDEPSEHMSPEGIEDMIETLHQRAHDTGRQIWLVDHSTMDFGGFSGTLTTVMDENGATRLEYK